MDARLPSILRLVRVGPLTRSKVLRPQNAGGWGAEHSACRGLQGTMLGVLRAWSSIRGYVS